MKLLIVDDQIENLQLLVDIFSQEPYEIMAAKDGQEALNLVEKITPDLILLDINMPVIDGYEVCRRLKANEATKAIQIIFLTAQGSSGDEAKGLAMGAVDYISKPFSIDIVKQRVKNHLELKHYQNSLQKLNQDLQERIDLALAKNTKQEKLAGMGEMISMIAHQWRQPLSAISVSIANIRVQDELNNTSTDKKNKTIQKMEQQVLYLNNTIDDFRNFFKTSKEKETIRPSDMIENVLALLHALILESHIEIKNYSKVKEPLHLFVNELLQAVLNIIKNACDAFNERDQKNKFIEFHDKVIDKKTYELTISDNAGGIPEHILEDIFVPYVTTKGKNGTGIGLYMSKMIIEQHMHGTIEVHNDNKGAVFTIRLPLP